MSASNHLSPMQFGKKAVAVSAVVGYAGLAGSSALSHGPALEPGGPGLNFRKEGAQSQMHDQRYPNDLAVAEHVQSYKPKLSRAASGGISKPTDRVLAHASV
jgi:hypothetical protein